MNAEQLGRFQAEHLEYCAANGLDPARTSSEWRPDAEGRMVLVGHMDLGEPTPRPGFVLDLDGESCCCGTEGCDGGLAEWGIDPAEVTEHRGRIPLGAVDCE